MDSTIAGHVIHCDDIKRFVVNARHASAVKALLTHSELLGVAKTLHEHGQDSCILAVRTCVNLVYVVFVRKAATLAEMGT